MRSIGSLDRRREAEETLGERERGSRDLVEDDEGARWRFIRRGAEKKKKKKIYIYI